MRREVRDVFREQRNAILRFLSKSKKSISLEIKDDQDGGFGLPSAFPDWDAFKLGAQAISERMTPILTATWDVAGQKFAPRVGLDPDSWSVVNPHTAQMIQDAAFNFCDSTNDSTSEQLDTALTKLRQELTEGIVEHGEALSELTKRVQSIFDKAERGKAREIAQTETSRAVHAAQEQAAIESGVVTGWKWLASADACPEICMAIAARAPAVRLGQPFAIIGHNPVYQNIKFPPGHPSCNCSLVEVLDTDDQPEWHSTLHQPKPATHEEEDRLHAMMREHVDDVQRTWDQATGEYGKSMRLIHRKKRTGPLKAFRCNH